MEERKIDRGLLWGGCSKEGNAGDGRFVAERGGGLWSCSGVMEGH